MRKYYSLYGRLLSRKALSEGFKHVKRSKGATGIDGQSLSNFEANLNRELDSLLLELKEKRYQPLPVKRVTIPKEGGGERALGIPAVRDRIVQQALRNVLEPIFDPDLPPKLFNDDVVVQCVEALGQVHVDDPLPAVTPNKDFGFTDRMMTTTPLPIPIA